MRSRNGRFTMAAKGRDGPRSKHGERPHAQAAGPARDKWARYEVALQRLKEALERKTEGVKGLDGIRHFVNSLELHAEADGEPYFTSTKVDDKGNWWDGQAPAKHNLSVFLYDVELQLPEPMFRADERYLVGVKKARNRNRFTFLFEEFARKPFFGVAGNYGFATLEGLVETLPEVRSAKLILRTGESAVGLCARLFKRGCHVEVHLQAPDPRFISAQDITQIDETTQKLGRNWKALAGGRGSISVYHSVPIASLRAVLLGNRLLACGWLEYTIKRPESPQRTKSRAREEVIIDSAGSLHPTVIVEYGHECWRPLVQMFREFYEHRMKDPSPKPELVHGKPPQVGEDDLLAEAGGSPADVRRVYGREE